VEGKVRLRDDQVQLNCDHVRRYQPETTQDNEAAVSQPDGVPVAEETSTVEPAPPEKHRLMISITQTCDETSDITYLHKLLETLREFPGEDVVSLRVTNEERVINLKLSNISINYCPELHQRLVELVGEEGLTLETTN
jgi:hypothetical protein